MSTLTPEFSSNYVPDLADENSFVELDTSTLTELPSSSYGKFARLVYLVGGTSTVTGSVSGGFGGGTETSVQRTPSITVATTNGTIAAGAQRISIIFSTDFAGTVLGATFDGSIDSSVAFSAPTGDTLAAVGYTVTAGSARIVKISGGTITGAVQRTPVINTATTSGTVPAGTRKLTFIFSSDYTGTVLGTPFTGTTDTSVDLDAPEGDTLGPVVYTVATGSVRISLVQ